MLYEAIIGIAGAIGSGKTSLTKAICGSLKAREVSFGHYVSQRVIHGGGIPSREALQEMGQRLIQELGMERFVLNVLAEANVKWDDLIVIEGVRHLDAWEALSRLSERRMLVYLDVEEEARLSRASIRDGISADYIECDLKHPVEAGVNALRGYADVILSDGSIGSWVTKVAERARILGVLPN